MAVADSRGRNPSDAFAEIEMMDILVTVVEMYGSDLVKVLGNTDFDDEGVVLWGAKVILMDGKLLTWDERKGRK